MLKSSLRLDDKAVSEELRSADQDYRQDTLFEAVVTVGAIVAVSDGLVEDCERNELAAFVCTRPGLETSLLMRLWMHSILGSGNSKWSADWRTPCMTCARSQTAMASEPSWPRVIASLELTGTSISTRPQRSGWSACRSNPPKHASAA
jgi:hypothetical protein